MITNITKFCESFIQKNDFSSSGTIKHLQLSLILVCQLKKSYTRLLSGQKHPCQKTEKKILYINIYYFLYQHQS